MLLIIVGSIHQIIKMIRQSSLLKRGKVLKKMLWMLIAILSMYTVVQAAQPALVPLKKVIPTIVCDIKYATKDNFTGQQIYDSPECYVLAPVAKALKNVQQELSLQGLGLKIWDGYRPLAAQWKLWHIKPDERYVCHPLKGGRHCRGTSVDVTLVNLKTGKELAMPTAYDDFSEKAWANYENLPAGIKAHRKLLNDIMVKHGFTGIKCEWWHFDYKGWQECPSLDVPFSNLSCSPQALEIRKPFVHEMQEASEVYCRSWHDTFDTLAPYLIAERTPEKCYEMWQEYTRQNSIFACA